MKLDPLLLNESTYYSPEANRNWFSVSQIKRFLDCEKRAKAELDGLYQQETTDALLIGSYVDATLTGDIVQFRSEHPEIFTRNGEPRAAFRQADELVDRLLRDDLARRMLRGDHQQILTGFIGGQPFRAKLDCWLDSKAVADIHRDYPDMSELLYADGAIVDLKVMRSFEPGYRDGMGRMNWIEYWRYDLQLAVYQELKRQEIGTKVPCYILAVTKEKHPNIGLYQIPQPLLDANLEILKGLLPRFAAIKAGTLEPEGCGDCEWCRKTKVLTCASWEEEWS